MTKRKSYAALFNDDDVNRWYSNLARGSKATADVYLRRLGNFCKKLNITPKELTQKEQDEIYDLLLDTVTSMEEEYSGGYVHSIIKAIKSWLTHNRIEIKRKIKIKGTQDAPTLMDERVPTKAELKRIFLSGDKKTRATCVLVAHSGVRIKTIGNYSGNDGLRIEDFPELIIEKNQIEFEETPTILIVRRELSKAGHQYLTFLSEEGCEYLKDYLEMRIRNGEELSSKSAIITPKRRTKSFIRVTNVGDVIRNAIRKAGYKWRPYVLRSYFDTQLMLAESKGLIIRDYRQFWMGHKGDVGNRYTTNKCKFPPNVIEDMRGAYRKSQDFLQTKERAETSEEKLKETFRKQLLLVAGFDNDEIESIDLLTDDE
ncbi:site-specific integrase, partial [bacterium]|nr:site-specific integrase [bacterium]